LGQKVKLEGLGKFEVKPHAGRKIKNIKTKTIMETKPYKDIAFSPCAKLKKLLNAGNIKNKVKGSLPDTGQC
jgi:nucleoid DNA-binding protein